MPWSKLQMKLAQAVAHGWKPKGSARGFSKAFADQVIAEGVKGTWSKLRKKRKS